MALQPVLIAGQWRQSDEPSATFTATNPATRASLAQQYPVSSAKDIERALQAGQEATAALRTSAPEQLALFLETFAANIESRADTLVEMAHLETGLPSEPRLRTVELPRTTNQLRLAAAAARERSWCRAIIDTQTNIRVKYGPLGGPVTVFGPNNFPFAFNSISGGDFAAAIASGNPVIAKGNPGHPGTTKILAEAAFDALQESGLPLNMVQLIYHMPPDLGLRLVADARLGATAFTGSRRAGLKLKEAADHAGNLIYLEMSSINPVFVLPGALAERGAEIAAELYNSCALGAGQFCTSPGLTVIQHGGQSEQFIEQVKSLFEINPPGTLLGEGGPKAIAAAVAVLTEHGAQTLAGGGAVDSAGFSFANTLLRVPGGRFLRNPAVLQTEAFGTVNMIVVAADAAQMVAIAGELEGNLTGAIYSHTAGADDALYDRVEPLLRERVGRLLNDKMPTGVAVVSSMNHGGPFPATGHPGFTAVGIPPAMLRFGALHCYDNVRHHRLPPELQDKNPTGQMWRMIDRRWTQRDI